MRSRDGVHYLRGLQKRAPTQLVASKANKVPRALSSPLPSDERKGSRKCKRHRNSAKRAPRGIRRSARKAGVSGRRRLHWRDWVWICRSGRLGRTAFDRFARSSGGRLRVASPHVDDLETPSFINEVLAHLGQVSETSEHKTCNCMDGRRIDKLLVSRVAAPLAAS